VRVALPVPVGVPLPVPVGEGDMVVVGGALGVALGLAPRDSVALAVARPGTGDSIIIFVSGMGEIDKLCEIFSTGETSWKRKAGRPSSLEDRNKRIAIAIGNDRSNGGQRGDKLIEF
jgi:hypothetical protein